MPSLVEDLDSLPPPDRELFKYAEHVGKTGEIEVAVGRGCPQQCAYCINDWVESLYSEDETWPRYRSPEHVMEEIQGLRRAYGGARIVRFLDHSFALDASWLGKFLPAYTAGCDLPFRCHLRANSIDEPLVRRLADAGCTMADVEVISGSDFVRNEIFDMDLSNEQIRAAFSMLRGARIETRAIIYLGSPYDSEAAFEETHALLRALSADLVDIRAYYPFAGTRAQETSRDNSWLHPRGEAQYRDDQCGINMPACRPDVVAKWVRRFRKDFRAAASEPWWRRWGRAKS
jgi:radical SAM superfamily enzyme YgiQ (UPF0313 family)